MSADNWQGHQLDYHAKWCLSSLILSLFCLVQQQLEIITPFQLYFNPDLILRNYQVSPHSSTSMFILILRRWIAFHQVNAALVTSTTRLCKKSDAAEFIGNVIISSYLTLSFTCDTHWLWSLVTLSLTGWLAKCWSDTIGRRALCWSFIIGCCSLEWTNQFWWRH